MIHIHPIQALRYASVVILIAALHCKTACAVEVRVALSGEIEGVSKEWVAYRATRLMSNLNTDALDTLTNVFRDAEARTRIAADLRAAPCESTAPYPVGTIVLLPNGTFEVRNLSVWRTDAGKNDVGKRSLVIEYTKEGLISAVWFALEAEDRQMIMTGDSLEDFTIRQKILSLIENYRTAYDTKNLDYIEHFLSDSALIIVGNVLHQSQEPTDATPSMHFNDERAQYLRVSKQQYLERLGTVFESNEFINVAFDSIAVTRHPLYPDIYGVNLEQTWRSSTYSDSGYLFLAINYENKDRPLLTVRCWQAEKFENGTTTELGDIDFYVERKSQQKAGE